MSTIQRAIYCKPGANPACNFQFTQCELWSRDIQCNYISAYLGFNIQLKVAPVLLEVTRQCYARYTANPVPNAVHTLHLSLCELWSRTYTKYLQLRIYVLQYSMERICAAIGDISTIQFALYCTLGAERQLTASSLRCVNCGAGHIQSIYSSAYLGFNIQL
jgi:hypothetical protein